MPKKTNRVAEHTTEITATGVIVPAAWDSQGQPVSVILATYDEEEFLVSMTTAEGIRLRDRLQQKVCVTGTLGRTPKNKWLLRVKTFETVDEKATADELL